jgi:hypothetical protein
MPGRADLFGTGQSIGRRTVRIAAQIIRLGTAPGRLSNQVADHIGGSAARG